jgi:hypothetical protein
MSWVEFVEAWQALVYARCGDAEHPQNSATVTTKCTDCYCDGPLPFAAALG